VLSIGKTVACSGEYYIVTVAQGREKYYTVSGDFWDLAREGARRMGLEGAVDQANSASFSPVARRKPRS
jgi:hypothetical protein